MSRLFGDLGTDAFDPPPGDQGSPRPERADVRAPREPVGDLEAVLGQDAAVGIRTPSREALALFERATRGLRYRSRTRPANDRPAGINRRG